MIRAGKCCEQVPRLSPAAAARAGRETGREDGTAGCWSARGLCARQALLTVDAHDPFQLDRNVSCERAQSGALLRECVLRVAGAEIVS